MWPHGVALGMYVNTPALINVNIPVARFPFNHMALVLASVNQCISFGTSCKKMTLENSIDIFVS